MTIIDINIATRSDLLGLKGIGPKIADSIIQGRPYLCPNQLLDIQRVTEQLVRSLERQGLWVDYLPEKSKIRYPEMNTSNGQSRGCGMVYEAAH